MAALHPGWEPIITIIIDRVKPKADDRATLLRLLYSPAPAYREDPVFLTRFEERVARLYEAAPTTPAEQQVAEELKSGFDPRRRWHARLPDAYTGGVPVFVLEAQVPWADLPRNFELGDIDHCQPPAQRDPRDGVLEMLPYTERELLRRHDQRVQSVARRGVEVRAVRVQANALLYERNAYNNLPALALIAFDPRTARDDAYLVDLAERLFELKSIEPRDAAERQAQAIILANEQRAMYHRRRQLPPTFTRGPIVYACDLWVHRPYLVHGCLTAHERFLNCVPRSERRVVSRCCRSWKSKRCD